MLSRVEESKTDLKFKITEIIPFTENSKLQKISPHEELKTEKKVLFPFKPQRNNILLIILIIILILIIKLIFNMYTYIM
jgi:hypothetical protein